MELSAVEIVYIVVMSVGAVCSSILSFFSMKRSGKTSKEVLSLCEKLTQWLKKKWLLMNLIPPHILMNFLVSLRV